MTISSDTGVEPDTGSDAPENADTSPETDTSTEDSTDTSTEDSTDTSTDDSTDAPTDTPGDDSSDASPSEEPAPDDAPSEEPSAETDPTAAPEAPTDTSTDTPTDTPSDTSGTPDTSALSAVRTRIIDELLPGVVPSSYGDQRFTALTFGLKKDSPGVTPGYTTCGSLPMYVARKLGDQVITGTYGVRTAGLKKNAWVQAGGDARPKPGDIYALLDKSSTDRANGGISHVGVIVDASTDEWKTADAGQGDGWAAAYVTRQYDAAAGTLSGEIVGTTGPRPARMVAGWIDVDLYPFPQ